MSLGFKLKKLRENVDLSQTQLADILGISQTSLSHIENGIVKKFDFFLMFKICKEFKVDFDYFIDDRQSSNMEIKTDAKILDCNNKIGDNYTYGIIEQIKVLIADNKQKEIRIRELEAFIANKKTSIENTP